MYDSERDTVLRMVAFEHVRRLREVHDQFDLDVAEAGLCVRWRAVEVSLAITDIRCRLLEALLAEALAPAHARELEAAE